MEHKEAKEILDAIEASDLKLTDWENGFIKSVSSWINKGRAPSDKQADVLAKIHSKIEGSEE